jgi:spore germination cell wall hydrolase CwlJ-like protein
MLKLYKLNRKPTENCMRKHFFLVIVALFILSESIGIANYTSDAVIIPSVSPNIVMKTADIEIDDTERQIKCLALNIYFEAAIQSTAGKLAVALVTHNRVKSDRFPNTICEVVYDSKRDSKNNPILNRCQFSWYCDGKTDIPYNGEQWKFSQELAHWFYHNKSRIPDITDGSTHYHGDYIKRPHWARVYAKTVSIDDHIFYRE